MSALYTKGKELILSTLNLTSATINCYLVGGAYTFSAAHVDLSSIAAGDRKGPTALAGKTITGGKFFAAPTTFASVSAPPASIKAAVLVNGTTDLIAYIDDFGAGAGNTTVSLNGSDIIITWNANGIFFI